MKNCISVTLVFIILVFLLCGCFHRYTAKDFIGKTSAEITNQYGEFDCVFGPANDDGSYKNCRCGYTVKEPQKRFMGTSPEILLFITFDANGVAISVEEGYRPGG